MPTTRGWIVIAIGYVAWMAVVVGLLLQARGWAESADEPGTERAWQEWKEDVRQQNERQNNQLDPAKPGVARHVPQSGKPPGVILLRDHFPGVLISCLILASFLYAVAAFLTHGALSQSGQFPAVSAED